MKVAYLGPEGSYTNIAAKEIFKAQDELDLVPVTTITSIVHDLETGIFDQVVVPIENSIAGGVNETVDALLKSDDIYISSEFVLPISHCLLVSNKDSAPKSAAEISLIRAHHMSLGQCNGYLRSNIPELETIPSSSNSAAARWLANEEDISAKAVIASKLCAEIYDLQVLADQINDASINETRFWVLAKVPQSMSTTKNKTSVVFQTKDEPGSLQQVLRLFAVNHVNLSRIESRSAKRSIGEYMFLIDFDLHKEDPRYEELMRQVNRHLTFYKWLGSYSC